MLTLNYLSQRIVNLVALQRDGFLEAVLGRKLASEEVPAHSAPFGIFSLGARFGQLHLFLDHSRACLLTASPLLAAKFHLQHATIVLLIDSAENEAIEAVAWHGF